MSFESNNGGEIIEANLGEDTPGDTELTPQAVLDARKIFADWDAKEFGDESEQEMVVNDPSMLPTEPREVYEKKFLGSA